MTVASAVSWSGGKDSALALQAAIDAGAEPAALLTMLDETGTRSRSHGLPLPVLEAQAGSLGLPLIVRSASWADYTTGFTDALHELRERGCTQCVFGDIDIEDHRRWCQNVCAEAGLVALHPIWQRDRREILAELLGRGFTATIVVVRAGSLDRSFLGRRLDAQLADELAAAGIDPCGENGEFHTVVTGGPPFARELELRHGTVVQVADRWTLQVSL
jgi:diphthine-ammonia ligase